MKILCKVGVCLLLPLIKVLIKTSGIVSEQFLIRGRHKELRKLFEIVLKPLFNGKKYSLEKTKIGDVPAVWLDSGRPGPIILYLHGGGYVQGSPVTHRSLAAAILDQTGGKALLPDYRLAPEHPFPAQREDSCRVYQWLLDRGHHPGTIVIAGDSAGGGLVAATVQELQKQGIPLPSCCVCLSPWVDVSLSGNSIIEKAATEIMIQEKTMHFFARSFAGERPVNDSEISPLFGSFKGLPPFLIQVGTEEVLLDDSRRLADRLKEAEVPVNLEIYDDMFHVFQMFSPFLGTARKSLKNIGSFVNNESSGRFVR